MKHALLALATLLTLPCAAQAQSHMTSNVIGCRSAEDFKTWVTFIRQRDLVALDKFRGPKLADGTCIGLAEKTAEIGRAHV